MILDSLYLFVCGKIFLDGLVRRTGMFLQFQNAFDDDVDSSHDECDCCWKIVVDVFSSANIKTSKKVNYGSVAKNWAQIVLVKDCGSAGILKTGAHWLHLPLYYLYFIVIDEIISSILIARLEVQARPLGKKRTMIHWIIVLLFTSHMDDEVRIIINTTTSTVVVSWVRIFRFWICW